MRLSLDDVRSVSIAAQLGSLGRAAKVLNITQPALSRRIALAESSLGVRLFERLPQGVRATQECAAFLAHAELALANLDDACEAAQEVQASRLHALTVGFMDVLCDDLLMAAHRATVDEFERASIDFRSLPLSTQISADVLAGRVKLGLRYSLDENRQLESTWIADDRLVVACAPTHPLGQAGKATIEQLGEAQWIGYPTAIDHSLEGFDEALGVLGLQRWKAWLMDSVPVRVTLLKEGLGVSLLRRASITKQLERGELVEIQTPLTLSVPIYLIWRRGAFLGEVACFFAAQVQQSYKAHC
jgi:DNA-binding transcriptional LysR family regulator